LRPRGVRRQHRHIAAPAWLKCSTRCSVLPAASGCFISVIIKCMPPGASLTGLPGGSVRLSMSDMLDMPPIVVV
jgi:hypothetical protein